MEHPCHVLHSLPTGKLRLACGEPQTLHHVGQHGQSRQRSHPTGYHLALVVTASTEPFASKGYGNDGLYAIEELLRQLADKQATKVIAVLRVRTILQCIHQHCRLRSWLEAEQCRSLHHGALPLCLLPHAAPEQAHHLVVARRIGKPGTGQMHQARSAYHLFADREPSAADGALARRDEVEQPGEKPYPHHGH